MARPVEAEGRPAHADTRVLTLNLGVNEAGHWHPVDLARLPHLLVGGSRRSAPVRLLVESLTQLLAQHTAESLRILLVDNGERALSSFAASHRLLMPLVLEPALGRDALAWTVSEMADRYATLWRAGARSIASYNSGCAHGNPLPYLVMGVAELADLAAFDQRTVDDVVWKLGTMGRAVGIHLLLASTDCSVEGISGLVKTSVLSRACFAVDRAWESRTLLDASGAERLTNRNDFLFLGPTDRRAVRLTLSESPAAMD